MRGILALLLALLLCGFSSVEQAKAKLWAPVKGAYVEDAKKGIFHGSLKKVYQAVLDVLDDRGISVAQRNPDYIKSGIFTAGGIVQETVSVEFSEDKKTKTVSVKWRTYVVTTSRNVIDGSNHVEESVMGRTPEEKMDAAQMYYVEIFKKLNP